MGEKERRLAHLEEGACAKGECVGKGKERSVLLKNGREEQGEVKL